MELFVTVASVGGAVVLATRLISSSVGRRHMRREPDARAARRPEVPRVRDDGPDPGAQPRRARERGATAENIGGAEDVHDLEALPLSLEFLPEAGTSPPVTEDIFARLAQRRMNPDAGR